MTLLRRAASLVFSLGLGLAACEVADSSQFSFDAPGAADASAGSGVGGNDGLPGKPTVGSVLGSGGALASGRGGTGAGSTPGGVGAGLATSSGAQECLKGAERCDPTGRVAQVCGADGLWQSNACAFVCRNGACTGSCVPGTRQCQGLTPQRCDDDGAWVNDGAACATACESGVCSGACTNGATQCASGEEVQRCEGGVWGQSTACPFACMANACGGECRPSDTRCASSTEIETCSALGKWSFRAACDFVCTGKTCGGQCKPGAQRCASPTEVEVCGANGEWGAASACAAACVGDKCGGSCVPGTKRCGSNGSSVETCSVTGVWEAKSCPASCVDGACSSCTPGELECTSGSQQRMCNAKGEWDPPVTCEFACITDRCGGICKPGARSCVIDSATPEYRQCSATGQWGEATSCGASPACVNGMCQEDPKIVFVTSATYDGALGGLTGADQKCQSLASAAGLSGTFRAWLSDSTASPSTRFSKRGGPYKLVNGGVVALNWNDLITNGVKRTINVTERGAAPTPATPPSGLTDVCSDETSNLVWSGTTRSGTASTDSFCENWASSSAGKTSLGRWDDTKYWSAYCRVTTDSTNRCASKAPLYCFQQ